MTSQPALNSPPDGLGLVFNAGSGKIELAELPGAAGGEANTGTNVGGFNELGKAGVDFKFRSIDFDDNVTITQAKLKHANYWSGLYGLSLKLKN